MPAVWKANPLSFQEIDGSQGKRGFDEVGLIRLNELSLLGQISF